MSDTVDKKAGRKFKRARKRAGFKTQREVAEAWDVSKEQIKSIEIGRRKASKLMWLQLNK